jgi:serine protease Do
MDVVADVAEATMPSVGYLLAGESSTGSCWAFDEKMLVTSAHVVEDIGFAECQVRIGGRLVVGKVTGMDHRTDIAVLKVSEKFSPLKIQELVRIGETCISVGSPLGYVNSVTLGIVSAIGRSLELDDQSVLEDLLQTDAAINPGSSGGPVLNLRGEVIGVSTRSHQSAQGMHYAVSAKTIRFVTDILRKSKTVVYAKIGALLAEDMDKSGTVRVKVVRPNRESSPLRIRDEIVAIEKRPIVKRVDVLLAMAEFGNAKDIRVDVVREGVAKTLKIRNLREED